MRKDFDPRAAAQGGAGVTVATAFILAGIMMLLDVTESRIVWGIFLILCGVSFILGMMWFGHKRISEKDAD